MHTISLFQQYSKNKPTNNEGPDYLFCKKAAFDNSGESSPQEMTHMKYQALFSWKTEKYIMNVFSPNFVTEASMRLSI